MMDAVKYFKNKKRMTDSFRTCAACPFLSINNGKGESCCNFEELYPEEAVRIVEEWSKAHPIQTNADKFKEVFGKEPIVILRDIANDYGEWLYAPYEAPKGD